MNSQSLSAPISWRRMKLKYLVDLKSGEAIPGESIKATGDFPVYGGNGFRGYTNSFTHEGERILIGRQGALCGNVNYAKGKFWATEHAIVATPTTEFDMAWLGETLRVMNLNQYSQSAAQPGIAVEVIANLDIAVPPIHKQSHIANLLEQVAGQKRCGSRRNHQRLVADCTQNISSGKWATLGLAMLYLTFGKQRVNVEADGGQNLMGLATGEAMKENPSILQFTDR